MKKSIGFAAIAFMFSAPWCSPNALAAAPPRADCCQRTHTGQLSAVFCSRGQDRCLFTLRVAGAGQSKKGITATLLNPNGQFGSGRNTFCIEFTDGSGHKVALAKIQFDVTLRIGRVEAARAVPEIVSSGVGRYCARVVLGIPGNWKFTLRYMGAAGARGKIYVLEPVT